MDAQALFKQLLQAQHRTHRIPVVVRAGGRLVEIESVGLEVTAGGRMVVTMTPREPLRLVEALPSGVTELRGRRHD